MKLGLEVLLETRLDLLGGKRAGLIINPASVNSRFESTLDLFRGNRSINLVALFGPQHGIRGNTQDNMIEWASFRDERTGLPAFSLYGETRIPTPEMLSGIDVLVFDIPDVGTRVYTFAYTMALAMQAARDHGTSFVVLDRPNPIGGTAIEGSLLDSRYSSFVGMFAVPMRHGLTIGELALLFNREFGIGCELQVVPMDGWRRDYWYDDTGFPWVMPSPNIPTHDTAIVYPGTVLLEGTNVSEGRGTTRPFEVAGAPYADPYRLSDELAGYSLPGVFFRPLYFQPTFNKYAGELCGGVQIHVTDRCVFKPVLTGVAIVRAMRHLYPASFEWKQPPYEYVFDKLPFDVIAGGAHLRGRIERGESLSQIEGSWVTDVESFRKTRGQYLLYQ
ncbi:MAG TPA: DUF1343 domain-containing protein [Blastocatellia bacterium]|nr:DUF1343 domain-containing protein [Blastocatellia bacterium]